jgi:hypothetical protein
MTAWIVSLAMVVACVCPARAELLPLPADHASFPGDQGCVDCHPPHHVTLGAWAKAWFAKPDMTRRCLSCHAFAGPPLAPHNRRFADATRAEPIDCASCHAEHKGSAALPSSSTAARCNSCHEQSFPSFFEGHPPFASDFPHRARTNVNYDHATHLDTHFKEPKFAKVAPHGCTACHRVESKSDRHVQTLPFEQVCGACHDHQVTGKPLLLFRVPELRASPADPTRVRAACGGSASAPTRARKGEPEFESVSDEELPEVMAYLLGVASDDPAAYHAPVSELMIAMAEEGATPLAKLVDAHDEGAPPSRQLLAGLHRDIIRSAACAWVTNREYDSADPPENGGWYTDSLELRYKPMNAKDPVLKAWIEFALNAVATAAEGKPVEYAAAMLSHLLSTTQGAGRCAKCHALITVGSEGGKPRRVMEWSYRGPADRPHTFFDHGLHVHALPDEHACETCHVLDPVAEYASSFKTTDPKAFVSNFKSITKDTCLACHGHATPAAIKHDLGNSCTMCHTYHLRPTLRHPPIPPHQ